MARRTVAFSWQGMFLRFIFAIILVFGTWNPKYWSYVTWVMGDGEKNIAVMALVGVIFLIAWVAYLYATTTSLGVFGVGLVITFFAVLAWVFYSQGLFELKSTATIWIIELIIACVLAIGMSWSIIWRKMSGQVSVDHVDG